MQPEVLKGYVQKNAEIDNHNFYRQVLKDKIKEWGLDIKVDLPGELTQEHVGPVRMRVVLNQAAMRNEERRKVEIDLLHSGRRVLEKVTHHMSVFTKGDLERAVKVVPDQVRREELVKEALSDQSVLELFNSDGSKSGYFTTIEVRKEELKIFRLSGYIARGDNVFSLKYSKGNVNGNESNKASDSRVSLEELVEKYGSRLTKEQYTAFKEIITSKSGLNIVRGRAGVGKSHVLGSVLAIAKASGIEVIGLTPTHKAKEALARSGFDRTDTVKGMLFRLKNGRFFLPKHSLLVVDEAGMVGNEDYLELLRVAATRKCQVILSGDERQLSSVARGGMFSSFADKYGSSTILDIKRQSSDWGRAVAKAFSKGEVERGIKILEENERIVCNQDGSESIQDLLSDWHKSSYDVNNRLIIAVKNKDVSVINHGVREYLKLDGILKGKEIEVNGHYFMKGDKIMMTSSNKKLGIVNGDIGVITKVSTDKFEISMLGEPNEGGKERIIEFDPKEYSRFKHGYAVTVFKSQGATIRDVYVYHSGFAGLRNSYVALSRNEHEVKLYTNKEDTLNRSHLIRQLSYDPDSGSSLSLYLKEEIENIQADRDFERDSNPLWKSFVNKVRDALDYTATKLLDKYLPESEYYNYREEVGEEVKVREVFEELHEAYNPSDKAENTELKQREPSRDDPNQEKEQEQEKTDSKIEISKQEDSESSMSKKAGNDNNYSHQYNHNKELSSKVSQKDRFYAKADYLRNREQYKEEIESLRGELAIKSESIVRVLLGEPNKKLSTSSMLRYGNNGALTVKISGERSGMWYDFSRGEGGDLIDLVKREKQLDFKESVDYLKEQVGGSRLSFIGQVEDQKLYDKYTEHTQKVTKEKSIESAKIRLVKQLYEKSNKIEQDSIVSRYLREVRKIDIGTVLDKENGDKSDIRSTLIYKKQEKQEYPVLIAFARNAAGEITGGQQIFLGSKTNNKADISIPKKSFGKLSGSFVEVSGNNESKITIIAEGIETALSLSSAGIEGKILCSLGISNIKNYPAKNGEQVIIAADNDGNNHITTKTIEKAKEALSSKGAEVEVIRPEKLGDFNDLLKESGAEVVKDSFNKALKIKEEEKDIVISGLNTSAQIYCNTEEGQHIILKNLALLSCSKKEAKTPNDALKALIREHYYRLLLHKKLDNKLYSKALIRETEQAYHDDQSNVIERLSKLRYYIENSNVDSKEITKIVKYSPTLKETVDQLQLICEKEELHTQLETNTHDTKKDIQKIIKKIEQLNINKQHKTTEEGAFRALTNETNYLASLYGKIDHQHYPKDIIKAVEQAYHDKQHKTMLQLYRLRSQIDRTDMKSSTVINTIKHSKNSAVALKNLSLYYSKHMLVNIHKIVDHMEKTGSYIIGGEQFKDPIKLIDHVLKAHDKNEFLNKAELQNIRNDYQQLQHHKDFSQTLFK